MFSLQREISTRGLSPPPQERRERLARLALLRPHAAQDFDRRLCGLAFADEGLPRGARLTVHFDAMYFVEYDSIPMTPSSNDDDDDDDDCCCCWFDDAAALRLSWTPSLDGPFCIKRWNELDDMWTTWALSADEAQVARNK